MKYLIAEDFSGQPVCFLFPRRVDHVDMRDQLPYASITAAGYVEQHKGELRCFGGSAELQLKARPQDAGLIAAALLPQGDEVCC